jgi:hypothetical protein
MKYRLAVTPWLVVMKVSTSVWSAQTVLGYNAELVQALIKTLEYLKDEDVNFPYNGSTKLVGGHIHWVKLSLLYISDTAEFTPLHWFEEHGTKAILVLGGDTPDFNTTEFWSTISKYLLLLLRSKPVIPIANMNLFSGLALSS